MNTKELNDIINSYTHGTLSAIEFLLKVQLEPHAVQNLLTASKLPAKALHKIDVGDLMSTDDIEIRTDHERAKLEAYVASSKIPVIVAIADVKVLPKGLKFMFASHHRAHRFIDWANPILAKHDDDYAFKVVQDIGDDYVSVNVSFATLDTLGIPWPTAKKRDEPENEVTCLETFNAEYIAKCNARYNAFQFAEIEIPRMLPVNTVFFKFVEVSHARNFIVWLQSNCDVPKEAADLEWYEYQGFRVVKVPSFILDECEIPYNPPKQVIDFITEQMIKGSMNEEKKA